MQKLKNAKNLAPGKVWPMFSLVSYLDEVAEAMAFMFSDTLICNNVASVQAVRFARNVSMRSITLEGDMYELSGTMFSGAAPSGSGMLVLMQVPHAMEERVDAMQRTLEVLKCEETKGLGARDAWRACMHKLKINKLHLLQEQVGSSNTAQMHCCPSLISSQLCSFIC